MFPAIIAAVGGVVGAGINANARRRSDYMNSPQGIRENAEKAGFNPLTVLNSGMGTGAQYAPTMGNIIANTAATVGDQLNASAQMNLQRQQLEQENARLSRLVSQQTLRPHVAGVYSQRQQDAAQAEADTVQRDGRAPDINVATHDTSSTSTLAGNAWEHSPAWSNADRIEERYGDLASMAYGAATIAADVWHNYRRSPLARVGDSIYPWFTSPTRRQPQAADVQPSEYQRFRQQFLPTN